VDEIESNGGRNDIKVTSMWAMDEADYNKGEWGFFSMCRTSINGSATASIVGAADCNQGVSLDPVGSPFEVSASGAYMLAQSALPFANPGHLRGLTVQRLFKKVLETGAPHLFMSSFNEFIGGRQASAYIANTARNMGLPYDSQNRTVWVDTYASEFSRDMEPNKESGDRIWRVTSSCVQLYKAGRSCGDADASQELCCTTEDKEIFGNIWSLRSPNSNYNSGPGPNSMPKPFPIASIIF